MPPGRFLVHDREDSKRELFVTRNFGETFSHAGDFIKAFYLHYSQVRPHDNPLKPLTWVLDQ